MEVRNTDLTNVTDDDIESLERVFKIARCGRHYKEDTELVNSWLTQWSENPEYNSYKAKDVDLYEENGILFLVSQTDGKIIKLTNGTSQINKVPSRELNGRGENNVKQTTTRNCRQ